MPMAVLDRSVLIVEDEFIIAETLATYVEDMGLPVCGRAITASEALALAIKKRPCVVLMDVRLVGEEDGVHAAIAIHKDVGSRVIFITGSREPATLERINMDHPFAVLFKPMTGHQLKTVIEKALAT